MGQRICSVVVAFVLVTGLEAPAASVQSQVPQKKILQKGSIRKSRRPFQVGSASWYGKQFHGKPTASGEPFNMYQLTAAHRTLPLGSWVKVTNLRNHRWIMVRVNDRGPVPTDRIIDLSYVAAQMLDMKARGIDRVRLDLINDHAAAEETLALLQNRSLF